MVKIQEAILVEGKYDKNTLLQIVDAPVLVANGFGIRKDKELMTLLQRVAENRGLIVFTDSDGAGFLIRNFVKAAIDGKYLKHAYIPDIYGKERRKSAPGKEGKLGVEGMTPDVILECLRRAGATFAEESAPQKTEQFTKQDFYEWGLSGKPESKVKRLALIKKLDFPEHTSSNALLQALNILYTKDEIVHIVETL